MRSIYEFADFRSYLKTFYEANKKLRHEYSYMQMAKELGLPSRGLLKMIIDGKRKLTHSNLQKLLLRLQFNKNEQVYFETLVHFNQSSLFEEKSRLFEQLSKFSHKNQKLILMNEKYQILSRWHYHVIIELTRMVDCPLNLSEFYKWVCEKLKKQFSVTEIQKACEHLVHLGFLCLIGNRYLPLHKHTTTEDIDQLNFAIQKFHQQMIQLSLASIEYPITERELGAVTLAFNKKDLLRAKEKIRKFRNNFNKEFSIEQNADCVYQLNVQFFELTEPNKITSVMESAKVEQPKGDHSNDTNVNLDILI